MATIVPLTFEHRLPVTEALVVFSYFCIKFAITVEVCNIPDVPGDRQAGVVTLPIVLGVSETKWTLYGLEIGSFALLVGAVQYGLLPIKTVIVFGIPMLYSLWAIHMTDLEPPFSGPGVYSDA